MKWSVNGSPGFATLDFELNCDERVYAQSRSMLSMTTGVEVTAKIGGNIDSGGMFAAVKGMLAGEGFATAIFTAKRDGERLALAPDAIGPIIPIELAPEQVLKIAKGSYLASDSNVTLQTEYAGVKGILTKKGLYLLKAVGPGTVFLTAHGDILHFDLKEGEKIAIDNDYVVAFDSSVTFTVVTASKGLKDSFLSGEGIINRYVGPGKVYYQSRGKARQGVVSTVLNTVT